MYESTPQEVIERETRPGPAVQFFESSSTSSSDTDDSSNSMNTRKRIKRAVKSMRKRKGSTAQPKPDEDTIEEEPNPSDPPIRPVAKSATEPFDTAGVVNPMMDPEALAKADGEGEGGQEKQRRKKHRHHKRAKNGETITGDASVGEGEIQQTVSANEAETKRVDFAAAPELESQTPARPKPFSLRSVRPQISKRMSQTVFAPPPPLERTTAAPGTSTGTTSVRGLRRANSLPIDSRRSRMAPGEIPQFMPINITNKPIVQSANEKDHDEPEENISRTSAILLLLVSTGLVALCAEFMVDSINEVVASNSNLSEAFIGLILLPIVGNAAEHVTAVTVALKNKMDLAIGVAVGSSIQIALFVTPLVVILGWIMNKEMSLFFTIFETVSLFVSAFIVNFLVLDGRSNYLEGALLCAAYVIIGTAAFFYPDSADASDIGGGGNSTADEGAKMMVRAVAHIVKLW
jgi:Ca2+:H+ antiporter